MRKTYKVGGGLVALVALIALAQHYFSRHAVAVLSPAGPIASKERNLLYVALGLSAVVVIPVFVLLFTISYKYREGRGEKYTPDVDGNRKIEAIWWGIPTVLLAILSVITWNSSHTLDPSRPLVSSTPPLTIQVVALQWKWLFIYPEQHIATVNYVKFPTNTPVDFEITADAPMNSFWIPRLGGQIYAMAGMSTQLHLLASKPGDYRGSSANISGRGFAGMHFVASASSQTSFENWVNNAKQSPKTLDDTSYASLVKPTTTNPINYYALGDPALYDRVVIKYMPLGSVQ